MATVRDHNFVFVPPKRSTDGSPLVCHCVGVTEKQLVDALVAGASTVAEIIERTGAGTGCTACRVRLRQYVVAFHSGRPLPPAATLCDGSCESCPHRDR